MKLDFTKLLKYRLPIIVIFSALIGAFILQSAIYNRHKGNAEYKAAEKGFAEQLIQLKASNASGIRYEDFVERSKDLIINANKLKISGQLSLEEDLAIKNIIQNASITGEMWKLSLDCAYKKLSDNCLNQLTYSLWNASYGLLNPNYENENQDDRIILSPDNSNFKEYKNVFVNQVKSNKDTDYYDNAVRFCLTKLSGSIENYFSQKGIEIY